MAGEFYPTFDDSDERFSTELEPTEIVTDFLGEPGITPAYRLQMQIDRDLAMGVDKRVRVDIWAIDEEHMIIFPNRRHYP